MIRRRPVCSFCSSPMGTFVQVDYITLRATILLHLAACPLTPANFSHEQLNSVARRIADEISPVSGRR